jgi:hypothetical protein
MTGGPVRVEMRGSAPLLGRLAGIVGRHATLVVTALMVSVLAAGVVYSFHLGDVLPYVDEQDHHAIAENVAFRQTYSNDGVRPNAARPPAYPLLLAMLVRLGAGIPELRIANFVMLCLAMALLYAMVRREVSAFAGVVAAALVVGYPVLFYAAGTLFAQTMGACLFVLVLYLLSRARSRRGLVVAGAVFGGLLLTIPIFVFSLVVVAAWLGLTRRERRLSSVAAFVAPALLVALLWSVRHYLVFGSFVFVSTGAGAVLLWGNSPHATIGGADVDFLADYYAMTAGMNEVERDAYFRSEALRAMWANKSGTIGFYLLKVVHYFSFYNEHYARSEATWWKTVLMAATYLPLLGLFVVRLTRRQLRFTAFEVLLIALYISSAFAYAIFHTRIRYRVPFDLALIALVGMFVGRWAGTSATGRAQVGFSGRAAEEAAAIRG